MFKFVGGRKPDFSNIKILDYDDYWRHRGFEVNKKLKEREEIIIDAISAGSKVIDIGCGNSLMPIKLKEKGCQVSVADSSSVVLAGFSKFGLTGLSIDLEDLNTLNLTENYDWIIMSEVLEHLRYPEEVIKKIKSKTKNFAITVPNSAFYRYRLHLMFKGRFLTQWVYHPSEHLRYWSHSDFLDWLDALGLKVDKVVASNGLSFFGFLPWLKNIWPNMFGHQIVYLCRSL